MKNKFLSSTKKVMLTWGTALFISSMLSNVNAQNPPQEMSDGLQAILNQSISNNLSNPGVVMSVHVPGQWTWTGASGSAINGMTAGKPVTTATPQSKFRIGSISKTFVATAIMLLEEQNLLSIDDTIGKYLRPSLLNDTINSSEPVKIRHLLNHTSGIDNSAGNMTCQQEALANLTANYSLEKAIYCGASQGEIFPPEFAWAYSNTNYSILAMIIEIVSGQTSSEYIYDHIILPLGLTNTAVPSSNEISGEHMGCYWDMGTLVDMTIVNPTLYWGWADLVSTAEDLNLFYKALLSGQIVNQTSLSKMKTMFPSTYDYGLGLDFYEIAPNKPYFGHTGEVGNSSSMWHADLNTVNLPEGYYVSYNFNYQGIDMWNLIDVPVYDLLKTYISISNNVSEVQQKMVQVYPNPCTDLVQLKFSNNSMKQIKIIDVVGHEIYRGESTSTNESISLQNLKKGTYFLEIQNGTNKFVETIVKN